MPQLDFSTYITQIFWVIVVFSLFWIIMDRFIVPRIAEQIEARKRKYNDLIFKAEEINKKVAQTMEQYKNDLALAKAKANERIKKNEQELKEYITIKEKEVDLELKSTLQKNEARLAIDKVLVLKKVDELSVNVANDILQKLNLNIEVSSSEIHNKEGNSK